MEKLHKIMLERIEDYMVQTIKYNDYVNNFIKEKYKEGFAVNAIVRMLKDQSLGITDEKVKVILRDAGIDLREVRAESKKYLRPGRFAHLK